MTEIASQKQSSKLALILTQEVPNDIWIMKIPQMRLLLFVLPTSTVIDYIHTAKTWAAKYEK